MNWKRKAWNNEDNSWGKQNDSRCQACLTLRWWLDVPPRSVLMSNMSVLNVHVQRVSGGRDVGKFFLSGIMRCFTHRRFYTSTALLTSVATSCVRTHSLKQTHTRTYIDMRTNTTQNWTKTNVTGNIQARIWYLDPTKPVFGALLNYDRSNLKQWRPFFPFSSCRNLHK